MQIITIMVATLVIGIVLLAHYYQTIYKSQQLYKNTMQLFEQGDIVQANEMLSKLYLINEDYYNEVYTGLIHKAKYLCEEGQYQDAVTLLLNAPKDDNHYDKLRDIYYTKAAWLLYDNNSIDSKYILDNLGDYKDSQKIVQVLNDILPYYGYWIEDDDNPSTITIAGNRIYWYRGDYSISTDVAERIENNEIFVSGIRQYTIEESNNELWLNFVMGNEKRASFRKYK